MTNHARKQVLVNLNTNSRVELFKLLDSFPTLKNATATVTDKFNAIFESIGGYVLALGGLFDVRKMVDYRQRESELDKISLPKREIKVANYKQKKNQATENDIVSTIKEFGEFTRMFIHINHSFPTFDYVCYFNENFNENILHTVKKENGPCTFQLTVGADHTNNVTWDSYSLFESLYSLSNGRKIKHFFVVKRSNFENFTYKKSFETKDPKLIEDLFKNTGIDEDNVISEAKKFINEADLNVENAKKIIANKALSEKLEQRVDQYCLKIE